MMVALSTSSPIASVALFNRSGELVASESAESNMRASEACLEMLTEILTRANVPISDVQTWIADTGPGSFTGTRVGVVLAKTFAHLNGGVCAGIDAFDLISRTETVALPSKRGEWFVRVPGQAPFRTGSIGDLTVTGFGPGIEHPVVPSAARALGGPPLALISPLELDVRYLVEPAISTPKSRAGGAKA